MDESIEDQEVTSLFEVDAETLSISKSPKFLEMLERSRNSQKADRIFLEDVEIPTES